MGRLSLLAFIIGSAWVQFLPNLPGQMAQLGLISLCVIALIALYYRRAKSDRWLILIALAGTLGFTHAALRADKRLADALDLKHENFATVLKLRIVGLPNGDASSRRFEAETISPSPSGIPTRLMVSWRVFPGHHVLVPEILPGQIWRMSLVLRQVHSPLNPYARDSEQRLFAQGIRAMASVRGHPECLDDQPTHSFMIAVQRIRYIIRQRMQLALGQARYGSVLIALALGDQAGIARDDWKIFNRTGITHLVSISGLHVTLIAGLGGACLGATWRRMRWCGVALAEYLPAQLVIVSVALGLAWIYCLLAGWGIPARRTFFTLAVMALAAIFRLALTPSRVLLLAAAVVTLLDPWSVVAPGFWLSFGAVSILTVYASNALRQQAATQKSWPRRLITSCVKWLRLQGAITLGLTPILAYLTQQISLSSPVVNALAIPTVSLLVTPASLVCAVLTLMPGSQSLAVWVGEGGQKIFEILMLVVKEIGQHKWAGLNVAAAPWPLLIVALFGIGWALQAPGWPKRHIGWIFILPLLCWRQLRPDLGEWRLVALDIGQGGAIVLETAHQVLLFDTGPRFSEDNDAGDRIIWPYLRARGIQSLDTLVISHADLDHVGGLRSLLQALPVKSSYASFDLVQYLKQEARHHPQFSSSLILPKTRQRCWAGQQWIVDEVRFEFLHPSIDSRLTRSVDRNASSCVLRIQGKYHSAIFPGDIGAPQERELVKHLSAANVVIAAHHGSNTSSSQAWTQAVQAEHVIAQVGYLNRFHHPSAKVQQRWNQAGAEFWRTDEDGAVIVISKPNKLVIQAQRDVGQRYWHRLQ